VPHMIVVEGAAKIMIASIRLMGTIKIYTLNNCRHSGRAAARFSLKLVRN
jgi:hypothetical protein